MARYALREIGVWDNVLGRRITRTDLEWSDYRDWLRTNTPDPMPTPPVHVPTAEEIAAAAELAEQQAIRQTLRAHAAVRALATRTPAQVDTWIDNNVTSLATAKEVLKLLAYVVAWLARRELPPIPAVPTPPGGGPTP